MGQCGEMGRGGDTEKGVTPSVVTPSPCQSMAGGVGDYLGPVLQVEAVQDFGHMVFDRALGDADGFAYLAVGLSLGDQGQYLHLARG